jgi:predicted TIM-barrel fold metal-dependent hydrolase
LIDPAKGKAVAHEARRLVRDFGVRGFKFCPTMQVFSKRTLGLSAVQRWAYPLYEAIAEKGAILLFDTGQTGVESGMPDGMRMRLKYSNPMCLGDVAVDLPDMPIVLAHPSFPGKKRRFRSRNINQMFTSTCPAGRQSISRKFW